MDGNMNRPIRVLHIVHSMNAGGIETFIMNVYRNINRENIQFDFLVNTLEECFYDKEIEELGGKKYVICTPYKPIFTSKYKNELNRFFVEHKEFKIVHCHRNATSVYALEQAKKNGILVRIAHSHIADFRITFRTPFYAWDKLFIKNYATDLFACSRMAGKWLYGEKGIRDKRFKVIPNAIDLSRFSYSVEKRNIVRKELGIENCLVVGHIGRFTYQKNHEFLIAVFSELHKKNSNTRLLLLGQGELEARIKNKCRELKIDDVVFFMGVKVNTEDYYNAMDIFVFPSIYEGLGIVAVEAQAAGLPVIASDNVPIEAKLSDRFYRLALNSGVDNWVKHIDLILNGFIRNSGNRDIISNGYDIRQVAQNLECMYMNYL